MSEYELADLMNGMNSNIIAGRAVFLSVVFAYLATAYTVGKNLTRYQVVFISILLILMTSLGAFAQWRNIDAMTNWGFELIRLQGNESLGADVTEAARGIFLTIRTVIVLGALAFMWQVRIQKLD